MKILEDFLTSIADAIRKKKATTDLIEAQSFANEIENLPQEITGNFQEKTISITNSGSTEITPDSDYDGLSKVTITPRLQTKTSTLTSASSTTITPDSGYAGLSSVSVTPAVQTKSQTITSNGTTTITPDSGKVGLSSVSITTNVNTNSALTFSRVNGSETSGETKKFTIPAAKKYGYIYVCVIHGNKCDISCTATNASVSTEADWYEGCVLNGTTIVWPQKIYKITKNNTTTASSVSVTLSNCYSVGGRFYYCFY